MTDVDVVVVGAGYAGLTAATALTEAGASVLVLEAADRPGGRALSETTAADTVVDLGGQWIGSSHSEFRSLAERMGIDLFPSYDIGKQTVMAQGAPVRLASRTGIGVAAGLAGLVIAARTGRGATDQRLVSDWLARVRRPEARRILDVLLTELTCRPANEISMAAMVDMFASGGGIRQMLTVKGGAQDALVDGGTGGLATRLAAHLGDTARTGQRVESIERSATGVVVHTASDSIRAAFAIVTIPPPSAAQIMHRPELPIERQSVQDNTTMGSVYKAVAVYRTPFWRAQGCNGQLLVLDGPIRSAFDVSPSTGEGHICVLVPGSAARKLDQLSPGTRRDAVLEALTPHFGDGAAEPLSFHEKAWHLDEFAQGGYLAMPIPGRLAQVRAEQARPVGRVHWAGTETSDRFNGYFEGAIRSGQRAAAEVLAKL